MEVKCPDCRGKFGVESTEYDHGDLINCPECNLELEVVVKKDSKYSVKKAKDKYLDDHDFVDFYDEENEDFED